MTKEDWKERIEPHLSTSLREVSETITSAQPIQQWLHEASFEAAQGLADVQGMQAEAMGYMHMIDDLDDTFPELVAAVEELTDGYGSIDLDWRPLTPNFSRLYVDFDWEADVSVFTRLDGRARSDALKALDVVAGALPDSDPFPNRPNTATGVVAHDGRAIAVTASRHLGQSEGDTYVRFTLLPQDGQPLEDVDASKAAQGLVQFFAG
jgi:hypothetical protein